MFFVLGVQAGLRNIRHGGEDVDQQRPGARRSSSRQSARVPQGHRQQVRHRVGRVHRRTARQLISIVPLSRVLVCSSCGSHIFVLYDRTYVLRGFVSEYPPLLKTFVVLCIAYFLLRFTLVFPRRQVLLSNAPSCTLSYGPLNIEHV